MCDHLRSYILEYMCDHLKWFSCVLITHIGYSLGIKLGFHHPRKKKKREKKKKKEEREKVES